MTTLDIAWLAGLQLRPISGGSDNVTANPGSGGATFASDDIGGVQYPRTKLSIGPDGFATDASEQYPLPVTNAGLRDLLTLVLIELRVLTLQMNQAFGLRDDPAALRRDITAAP